MKNLRKLKVTAFKYRVGQNMDILGVKRHGKKIGRYQRKNKYKQKIFKKVLKCASDKFHDRIHTCAEIIARGIMRNPKGSLINYIIKTQCCKAFIFILCLFFDLHAHATPTKQVIFRTKNDTRPFEYAPRTFHLPYI